MTEVEKFPADRTAMAAALLGSITFTDPNMPNERAFIYDFEVIVRTVADDAGIVDVRNLAGIIAGNEEVSEGDIQALQEEVKNLALSTEDVRDIGEGLFTILPPDRPAERPYKKSAPNPYIPWPRHKRVHKAVKRSKDNKSLRRVGGWTKIVEADLYSASD